MKRIWIGLIFIFLLAFPFIRIFGFDLGNSNRTITYWGTQTYIHDTLWIPGRNVGEALGGINGQPEVEFELEKYKYLGIEFSILDPDITIADTFFLSLWTGYVANRDSLRQVSYPGGGGGYTDSSLWGVLADQATGSKRMWWSIIPVTDTLINPRFFDPYAWLRVRTSASASKFEDSTSPGGDLYSDARGDSLNDWKSTSAGNIITVIDDAVGTPNYTDYIYQTNSDSVCVITNTAFSFPDFYPGIIDSLVVSVAVKESLVVIDSDTLKIGLAVGDTSLHGFGLMINAKRSYPEITWGAKKAVVTGNYVVKTQVFTVLPGGTDALTIANIDSCMVLLNAVHIDTVAAGTAGRLQIAQVWTKAYGSTITELKAASPVKWRCTFYLKE